MIRFRWRAWLVACMSISLSAVLCAQDDGPDLSVMTRAGTPFVDGDRLVCIGDSITQFGDGPNGFVGLLRAAFIKAEHPAVVVINAGVSGNTVPDVQARLNRDVIAQDPTVAFIYIGINDVWHHGGDLGGPKDRFEVGLRDMIGILQAKGVIVILATPTVIGEKPDGTNKLDASLDVFAQSSRTIAKEFNVELCDLRKAFVDYLKVHNAQGRESGVLTGDGVHLTAAGNALVAQEAAKSLVLGIPRAARTPILQGGDFLDHTVVTVRFRDVPEAKGLVARYTTDGSEPDAHSPVYTQPIPIGDTTTVHVSAFNQGAAIGPSVMTVCTKLTAQPAQHPGATVPGLAYGYYEGAFAKLPGFDTLEAKASGITPRPELTLRKQDTNYALRFTGFIDAPVRGVYTLLLGSDDGSRLILDGKTLIDEDGIHAMNTQETHLALEAGKHSISILYFQGGGDQALVVSWAVPGKLPEPIPAAAFSTVVNGK